jgi:hypothetical protein
LEAREVRVNEGQGKNGGANVAIHDVLYQQITSGRDEAIKVALGLVDEADKAAQKMVVYQSLHFLSNH